MHKSYGRFLLFTISINILIFGVLPSFTLFGAVGQEIRRKNLPEIQQVETSRKNKPSNYKTRCSKLDYSLIHSRNKLVYCDSRSVPILVRALKDSNIRVRMFAAYDLGRIGSNASSATPALIEILKKSNPNLLRKSNRNLRDKRNLEFVSIAVRTLGKIGPKANQAIPELEKYYTTVYNLRISEKGNSQNSISKMDVEAKEHSTQRVLNQTQQVLNEIDDAFQSILENGDLSPEGKIVLSRCTKKLEDDDLEVKSQGAVCLGGLGPRAKSAIPLLIQALKNNDYSVKFSAASALGDIGAPAVPALIEIFEDPKNDEWTKIRAGEALWHMTSKAKAAVPALIKQLQDQNPRLRSNAAFVLENIGPIEQSSIPFLIAALNDPRARVRSNAASALGAIDADGQSIGALSKALRDKGQLVSFQASRALGLMGPNAVPELLKALQDNDEEVSRYAIAGLISMGSGAKIAVPTLRELVNSPNEKISLRASMVLGTLSLEL